MKLLIELLMVVAVSCGFLALAILSGAAINLITGLTNAISFGLGMCIVSLGLGGVWKLWEK